MRILFVGLLALAPFVIFAKQDAKQDAKKPDEETLRLQRLKTVMNDRFTAQGDSWFREGDYLKVIELYRVRAEMFPHYENAWSDLSWMLFNVGDLDGQLSTAIQYKEQNPDLSDASFLEGNFYFQKKAYLKAIAVLEPSIAMTPPPHANTYRVLAQAYRRLGMLENAIRVWKEQIKHYPGDPTAISNLKRAEDELKKKSGG